MRRTPPKLPPSMLEAWHHDAQAADRRRLDALVCQLRGNPTAAVRWLAAAAERHTRLTAGEGA